MPDTITKRIEKILSERESKMFRYYESVFKEDFEGGYPQEYDSPLKSFIQSLRTETVDICLAEVEKKFEEHSIADGIVYDEGLPPADILPEMIRDIHIAREATNGTLKELKNALKQSLLKLKE